MKKLKGVGVILLAAAVLLSGCGVKVSNNSPESVVKSLVNAYQFEDEDAVKKCFGIGKKDKVDADVKKEIDYNLKYFKAHGAKDINFEKCESLGTFNGYDFVYVIYDYEMKKTTTTKNKKGKNEKKTVKLQAPAISTYFVKKKDKEYYVVPGKDITTEMSDISKEQYAKFVKTEDYEGYEKRYNKFRKDNPDYENDISEELDKLLNGGSKEKK